MRSFAQFLTNGLVMDVSVTENSLKEEVRRKAQQVGFSLCGFAPAARPDTFSILQEWLRRGYHGEMGYLARREQAYAHPSSAMKSVKSLILLGASYAPREAPKISGSGRVAAYAQGRVDYHEVLRTSLKEVAAVLHELHPGCRTRSVVDTAPVLERDFARKAGLGWFGKNTMLINKQVGSFLFLAAILTDVELPPDAMHESSHCGTCTRCLEVCPTNAFVEPYVLDARKCISYLTIELRGTAIPEDLREGVGEWLFGCDLCQDVCPWNQKPWSRESRSRAASPTVQEPLRPVDRPTEAVALLSISEEEFQQRYGKTPLSRPGREGMARNAAIVLGNTGDSSHLEALNNATRDSSPLVREAATWGLARLRQRLQDD